MISTSCTSTATDELNEIADFIAGDYKEPVTACPFFTPHDAAAALTRSILSAEEVNFLAGDVGLRRHLGVDVRGAKVTDFPKGMTRGNLRTLMQLRTGACKRLGGELHGAPVDCYRCEETGVLGRAGTAVEHMFACASSAADRKVHFPDSSSPEPDLLWVLPKASVAYAETFWKTAPHVVQRAPRNTAMA